MTRQLKILNDLILEYQNKFRILKDYKITYDNESEYKLQSFVNSELKEAVIYGCDIIDNDCFMFFNEKFKIERYIFHEMIHICMREIMDEKSYKKKRNKEELFVQDLEKIYFERN